MKKTFIAIAAALVMGQAAMAQDATTGATPQQKQEQKADKQGQQGRKFDKEAIIKKRAEDMKAKYNLSDEQTAKIVELDKKYADKLGPRHGQRHGQHPGKPGMRRAPQDGQKAMPAPAKAHKMRPDSIGGKRQMPANMRGERKQIGEAMQAYDKELQQILTEEQYKAYKEDKAKERKKHE